MFSFNLLCVFDFYIQKHKNKNKNGMSGTEQQSIVVNKKAMLKTASLTSLKKSEHAAGIYPPGDELPLELFMRPQ